MSMMNLDTPKPKNVPEELKTFLESHPTEWFTNEELADHLCHTPSGIRNAVTKLKSTGLIQTRMTGSLAYRGWHTAPRGMPLPLPEMQKRMASRKCNGCGTAHSRYWRSDLEETNGWLCNNCGMNQRRGRGIHRVAGGKRKCGNCGTTKSAGKWRRDREIPDSYLCNKCGMNQRRAQLRLELQQQRAAAEALAGVYEQAQRQHYSAQQLSPSDARSPSLPPLGHPSPLHIHSHPSPSSPGHKSLERSSSFSSVATQDGGVPRLPRHTRSAARPRLAASSRSPAPSSPAYRASSVPCNVCNECLPTIELAACKHRVCGECIPVFIRHSLKAQSIDCPVCARDHPGSPTIAIVPIMRLGEFIDSL